MGNCLTCFRTNNSNDGVPANQRVQISEKTDQDNYFVETEELMQATNLNHKLNHYDTNNFNKMPLVINGTSSCSIIDDKTVIHSAKESQLIDNAINKLFEEYKDKNNDAILSEGIEKLCQDLQYSPDEFPILVLAFCLDAKQMCKFTKQEFIYGLKNLNATTISDLRMRIIQIVEKLQVDVDLFKQLYRFTFHFGLDEGARILNLEMAMSLWKLVYSVHTPENNLLDRWLSFLSKENIRGIQRDTWLMFQNFAECFDINSYDSDEAWPSLFDDFVEYEISRLKKLDQNFEEENEQQNNNNLKI